MDDRSRNSIDDWKRYLQSKSLLHREIMGSESAFHGAMRRLDSLIASRVPSTKGMIWSNGQLNPNATIADVDAALTLLAKFGQATLDDLGDPSDSNRFSGTPLNSMFISQEDSNLDEWSPGGNQNQGREGSTTPKKLPFSGKKTEQKVPEKQPQTSTIDERMRAMTNLIENVEK